MSEKCLTLTEKSFITQHCKLIFNLRELYLNWTVIKEAKFFRYILTDELLLEMWSAADSMLPWLFTLIGHRLHFMLLCVRELADRFQKVAYIRGLNLGVTWPVHVNDILLLSTYDFNFISVWNVFDITVFDMTILPKSKCTPLTIMADHHKWLLATVLLFNMRCVISSIMQQI